MVLEVEENKFLEVKVHGLEVGLDEQRDKLNIESTQHCVCLEISVERVKPRRYYI